MYHGLCLRCWCVMVLNGWQCCRPPVPRCCHCHHHVLCRLCFNVTASQALPRLCHLQLPNAICKLTPLPSDKRTHLIIPTLHMSSRSKGHPQPPAQGRRSGPFALCNAQGPNTGPEQCHSLGQAIAWAICVGNPSIVPTLCHCCI